MIAAKMEGKLKRFNTSGLAEAETKEQQKLH